MSLRCAGCGEVFGSPEVLHRHEHEAHGAHAHDEHVCPACGMTFASGDELDAHARAEHAA